MNTARIRERLHALRDEEYAAFTARLIPGTPPEAILGVRLPQLRGFARELSLEGEQTAFLRELPHRCQEENLLHAFLIERIRDFERCLEETERFLPYVDNWAVCDSLNPPVFARHWPELRERIRVWMASPLVYTRRFGIGMLMRCGLDGHFEPVFLDWVAELKSGEYYVDMMRAWFFATALAKQYEAALPWLRDRRLDPWTHRKSIQKAVESRRLSEEQKTQLKALR